MMMRGPSLFPVAAVVLALLGLAPVDVLAAERSVARMGELRAIVNEPGWCGSTVAVQVRAPHEGALTADTRQLQQLAGGVRQILGLECPSLQQLQITGMVGGQVVGRWHHLADGRLVGSAASAQAVQPAALTEPLSRGQIAELQRRLSRLGYRPGPVDGMMGQRTARAIRAYQAANGLAPTGQPAAALAHMRGATSAASSAQGDPAATMVGAERAPLSGEEAYPVLLRRYIRAHPEAVDDPAFLPYFAGYECRAQGWGRQRNLNPFELREVKDAARRRLAAMRDELSGGEPTEGARIAFKAHLRLADYDFERQSFPISARGGSIEGQIRPGDFCQNVARQEGLRNWTVFPADFRVAPPAGEQAFDAAGVAALLGGRLAMAPGAAEELYASDFPNISVIVTGRVEGVTRATEGHSLVRLRPLKAEVRTRGNPQYSRQLAVLGADALTLPEPQSAGGDAPVADSLPGVELTGSALLIAALHKMPELLDDPRTAARYAYWSGERSCVPEANLRGKANAEFERQRLLEAAPQRAASKLAQATVHERFYAISEGELLEYDSERGAFGLRMRYSNGRPDDATNRFRFGVYERVGIPDCVARGGPELPRLNSVKIRDEGLLAAVPMEAGPAEQLVKANPERQVSIQLELRLDGFERRYGKVESARMELLRGRVIDAVSGELLKEVTLEQVNAARPVSSLWEDYAELDYRALFLHLVRSRPALAERSDFVDTYMRVEACNRVRNAEGNPITMARLQREFRAQLAQAVETTGRQYVRVVFPREELGQYDMDAERFPFISRRGDISFYRQVHDYQLRRSCRPGDDSEAPQAFSLVLEGMEPFIEEGLPMGLDTAETFLERFGGRKNGRERQVTIEVLASLGTPPAPAADAASEAARVPATVHAIRVLDGKDDSVLLQAGELPGEDETAIVEAEAPAPSPSALPTEAPAVAPEVDPERDALALVGVTLGMQAEQARQALAERFAPEAIAWLDDQTLAAEEGACLYHDVAATQLAEEAGSACFRAEFDDDGMARSVRIRNVVDGARTAALEELLTSRFGTPAERVKDAETETLILGWGDPLTASAEALGRSGSAGQALRALEGRISEAQGVTLVTLRLDAPPPESAESEPAMLEIRF